MAVVYTEKAWLWIGGVTAGRVAHGVLADGTKIFAQRQDDGTWRTVYGAVVVSGFPSAEDAIVDLQNALRADGIFLLRRG